MKYLLVLTVFLIGCSAVRQSVPPTPEEFSAAMVFPVAAGQKWDMKDSAGQLTNFEVLPFGPMAACQTGKFLRLHIAKDSPEPYPDAGGGGYRISQADWIMKKDSGSWRLVSFMWTNNANGFFNTWQVQGEQYWFVNPTAEPVSFPFTYTITNMANLLTCMDNPAITGNGEQMLLTDSYDYVNTPVYSGRALRHDWCEQDNPPACDRAHEVWWYAPRIGVVQIQILGPNTADGPIGYTTKRIN